MKKLFQSILSIYWKTLGQKPLAFNTNLLIISFNSAKTRQKIQFVPREIRCKN